MVNDSSVARLAGLKQRLLPVRQRLLAHPVYRSLKDEEGLRDFLSHHVFAVWDFMSLVKALQRRLTCLDEVWVPRGDRSSRRLINEIVLGEESDDVGGAVTSHFEMYLEAMRQVGCSTADIDAVLARVVGGENVKVALEAAPHAARQFSRTTFAIVKSGSLPAIAAAFTFGREEIIPDMFSALVEDLQRRGCVNTSILQDYLARHIELDGGEHGPMAERLLLEVCGEDDQSWDAAGKAAEDSLVARIGLWDGVLQAVNQREQMA